MRREIPTASPHETDFACPHCGAHAKQEWFNILAKAVTSEPALPFIPDMEKLDEVKHKSQEEREEWEATYLPYLHRLASGLPNLQSRQRDDWARYDFENVFASQCFNCSRPAIWVHDKLLYPEAKLGAEPSPDLPPDIINDYEEARIILNISPRGAAALLRLAVQKLCTELGEKGRKIDDDIASLVAKGLDPEVQQALDAVGVIGNDAVHPGQIDLRDDREAALQLFDLVNFITDQTITRKKKVAAMYARIPPEKQKAINDRNAKAITKGGTSTP